MTASYSSMKNFIVCEWYTLMKESDSWYSRWYEGCLLNTLILQMNFPPVWWLASIDQPHIQRLVRRIDWWGWDIFFHTHSLDPKTEYIVDRASKYILKITTSPAVSFERERVYYRALREAIWDMIPKTLFFSGKTAEIDEDYPGENHRIWALMRYVWRDALLGDLFDREYISSLKLYKTGRELTTDDKRDILRLLRRFLDGADQALRKTGVIVDV